MGNKKSPDEVLLDKFVNILHMSKQTYYKVWLMPENGQQDSTIPCCIARISG